MDGPQRILIVRLSAIGDVIHGIPVLCALRQALPDAFIGWVVESTSAALLEGHPALDELIRVPRGWLKWPREVWRLRQRLHALRFDAAIDLQCLTKSAIAAWLSGAPRRIGKAGEDGREFSRWLHNELITAGGEHVIEHYLQMLRPLGIETSSVRFDLPEHPAAARTSEQFLRTSRLSPRSFAILNPGAGWPSKIWPAERYGELALGLWKSHGLPSVAVWGGNGELRLAERIVAASSGHARLAPPTSMTELGRTLPPGRAVRWLGYRPHAPGGGSRHANDQLARSQPGRVVWCLRSPEYQPASSLRGRIIASPAHRG